MNPAPFQLESSPTPSRESLASASCCGSLDLRLGDCMDVMKTFPDGHFDLAIVDPPYGIGRAGHALSISKNKKKQWHKHYPDKGWDERIPSPKYFAELRRVSSNQIVWGGNYFTAHLPASRCWVLWYKGQRDLSMADGEMAWCSFDQVARQFELHRTHLWQEGTIHPTQKPVKLYSWLMEKYAAPGMKVLDTHLGSGSIAIAAHYAGMHLTACEIDADYFAAACARIKTETAQESFNFPNIS